ncbi:MAG: hypothetical protein IJU55_00970 [Selenomonadaceae bacterium]|nr:hypothetical protein [Selenomonadaceae bacterium]
MKLKMNLTVALLKKTNVKILSKFWGVVDGSQGGDSSTAKKKRPRKSCIDWADAIFQNVTLPEIFKAQKELKKYLKLGQIELAENIFAMLKTLCKNYRAAEGVGK